MTVVVGTKIPKYCLVGETVAVVTKIASLATGRNILSGYVLGRKEMFYLTTHSTHFIYGYVASDMWEESCCRHMGYSFRLAARVLLYAPFHRQDSTYQVEFMFDFPFKPKHEIGGALVFVLNTYGRCIMSEKQNKNPHYILNNHINMLYKFNKLMILLIKFTIWCNYFKIFK